MTFFANINGHACEVVTLHCPGIGPWFAECELAEAPELSGRVTLTLGDAAFSGTIDPTHSGVFGERRRCRIIAGAGGWGTLVTSSRGKGGYHNDAGVKARDVAEDVAREVGETLGTFAGTVATLGNDYARPAGPASRTLEDAARGAAWWVDRAGVTHVGVRASTAVTADIARVISYSPAERLLELAPDSLAAIDVGAVVTDGRLEAPVTIHNYEIHVTPEAMRVRAWCGDGTRSRLADAMVAIAQRATDGKKYGHYRYRVVGMNQRRVNLQLVRAAAGLPDLLSIDQWPGIAGAHADLQPGGEVLVVFVDGDVADPVITNYIGGHKAVPPRLELGGSPASAAARQGDAVEILLPPAVFSGTISGAPASGVLTFPSMKAIGTITAGSGKVNIG